MHVLLHSAVAAHPQSPRIGRTRLASLGELTGEAGLQKKVGEFDSDTTRHRRALQRWRRESEAITITIHIWQTPLFTAFYYFVSILFTINTSFLLLFFSYIGRYLPYYQQQEEFTGLRSNRLSIKAGTVSLTL